jgi:hypothetical protein
MTEKQLLWKQTKELLKLHGITPRGEKTSHIDKDQIIFEKRMLTNAVGFGKRR